MHRNAGYRRLALGCCALGNQWYGLLHTASSPYACIDRPCMSPGIIQMSLTLPQVITPAFSNSFFAYSIEHDDILGGQLVWVVFFIIGESSCQGLICVLGSDGTSPRNGSLRKCSALLVPQGGDGRLASQCRSYSKIIPG